MSEPFRLLMISAMYENGGNTTQRLLDGHPELIAYPFESQLGTRLVQDHLSSLYPAKYRWPEFALDGTPDGDYEAVIDEECRVRIKTPRSSKFREAKLELDDGERKAMFVSLMEGRPRSRRTLTAAFLRRGPGEVTEANPFIRVVGLPAKVLLVAVLGWVLYRVRPRALVWPSWHWPRCWRGT